MKKLAVVPALLFAATVSAQTTAPQTIGLWQAYQMALEHDAQIAAARAQLRSGSSAVGVAKAALKPNLGLNAGVDYTDQTVEYTGNTPFAGGEHSYPTYRYSLQLNQPLYHKDAWEGYRQSKLIGRQAELHFRSASQDLALRVAGAYFDVLDARENLNLAQVEEKATLGQLERAQQAFDIGSATITDVNDARARADLTRARLISARNAVQVARQALAKLIGTYPEHLAGLKAGFPLQQAEPDAMERWTEAARNEALEVLQAEMGLRIAGKEIQRVKGIAYPSLDLVGSYTDNRAEGSSFNTGINTREAVVGLQLNVPLYSGGAVNAKLSQVRADRDQARSQLDEARRAAVLQAQQAFLAVSNGVLTIKALQQAENSSQTSLESTRRGQEVGVRTALDVLDAQQQLFSARRDLASARFDYLLSRLRLKAAVGELEEEDLKALDALLR